MFQFFQWADEMRKGGGMSGNKRKIQDCQSLRLYMSNQHVHFYGECQIIKKVRENINRYFKAPVCGTLYNDNNMSIDRLINLIFNSILSLFILIWS